MYWELTLRSGNSLGEEGTEWVHRREEGRVLHQDLLGPLGMRTEDEKRPQQVACCRAGNETGRLDLGYLLL